MTAVSASGGSAIDVLASIPSALVDADGNVTFRGSGNFLVYVNGRLSPLEGSDALRQIPASSIEDIEIIGHDILRTSVYGSERTSPGLHSITSVRPHYPNIVLSLTYNFNSSSHKSRSSAESVLFEGSNF